MEIFEQMPTWLFVGGAIYLFWLACCTMVLVSMWFSKEHVATKITYLQAWTVVAVPPLGLAAVFLHLGWSILKGYRVPKPVTGSHYDDETGLIVSELSKLREKTEVSPPVVQRDDPSPEKSVRDNFRIWRTDTMFYLYDLSNKKLFWSWILPPSYDDHSWKDNRVVRACIDALTAPNSNALEITDRGSHTWRHLTRSYLKQTKA